MVEGSAIPGHKIETWAPASWLNERETTADPSRRLKDGYFQDYKPQFLGLFFVAATAIAAEGVIEAVCGDHEAAAGEGYQYFDPMRRQGVSPEGSGEDKGESNSHEDQHMRAAMVAVSADESRCADRGDDNCQHAMGFLFRWKEMSEDCRE